MSSVLLLRSSADWLRLLSLFKVKHQIHKANVQQMMVIIKNCMEENTKILENLSHWEKTIRESEEWIQHTKRSNDSLSDEVNQLKVNIKTLEEKNDTLTEILKQTQSSLENERLQNANSQDLISEKEKIITSLKESVSKTAADMAESQQEFECQIREQSDFQEQIKDLENTQKDFEEALSETDNNIVVLADCTSQLNCVSASVSEDMNGELAGDMNPRMNTQKHQMIDVSQEKNAISTAENALKPFKFHLSDLMPAVCKLQEYKKKLEADCSLLSAAIAAKEEHKTLQLKVESYSEIFEKQRMAAEEILKLKTHEEEESQARLSEVEEKVNTAAKEVQNYKQKIKAMEEKLQAAECSFREQIAPHEKVAHDTWDLVQLPCGATAAEAHSLLGRQRRASRLLCRGLRAVPVPGDHLWQHLKKMSPAELQEYDLPRGLCGPGQLLQRVENPPVWEARRGNEEQPAGRPGVDIALPLHLGDPVPFHLEQDGQI
ncbi:transport and Golgi organization protein 1 homolog isoform X3 [Dasypus novemcinctus]|uniref:transport and Golgi organization protein 1 homolog isoform X3 n=1 Tax=Dasypus novemcinctus TaxID=9361 RepID=UPI0026601C57|nr:transport and Golgi organization protein 1 homolog isoform X3 [Dasypus novemcinctus]